jgi:phage baseplate assembly protein W
MATGISYGVSFPFRDSFVGRYLDVSNTNQEEIRNCLIHLLLTRKGSRYYLPTFGTRLYEYIFEPLDGPTFSDIEADIRQSIGDFLPNLIVTEVKIEDASMGKEDKGYTINEYDEREFRVPGISDLEHTAKITINYRITNQAFEASDFVIINI